VAAVVETLIVVVIELPLATVVDEAETPVPDTANFAPDVLNPRPLMVMVWLVPRLIQS
jgi:hypothetical protein